MYGPIIFLATQFIYLIFNTSISQIEYLEIGKIYGPIISLILIAYLDNNLKIIILKVFYYLTSLHLIISILIYLYYGNSNESDNRLIFDLLGRGAGETAWAFSIFIVLTNCLNKIKVIIFSKYIIYVLNIISIYIIFRTEARASLIFISIFYINWMREFWGVKLVFLIPILITFIGLIGLFNTDSDLIIRSKNFETMLTGREFIWLVSLKDFWSQDLFEQIFGSNMNPKIHEIPEIGYLTADPHNLFIDIIQYLGFLGLLFILMILNRVIKFNIFTKTSLLAFVIMSLLVSVIRYPNIFYINSLFILTLTINFKRSIRER